MRYTSNDRVNAFVLLTKAVGGRPIYSLAWILWLSVAFVVTTGADLLWDPPRYSTSKAFVAGVIGVLLVCIRLFIYLLTEEGRRTLVSIDPRCEAQNISNLVRAGVILVPLLSLLAVVAVLRWRIWGL